jgi:site-specific recombinase XerD
MTRSASPTMLALVESFFRDYLVRTRGSSPHTVRAYRDTLRLLFAFLADRRHCSVADLNLDDLNVDAFLASISSRRSFPKPN